MLISFDVWQVSRRHTTYSEVFSVFLFVNCSGNPLSWIDRMICNVYAGIVAEFQQNWVTDSTGIWRQSVFNTECRVHHIKNAKKKSWKSKYSNLGSWFGCLLEEEIEQNWMVLRQISNEGWRCVALADVFLGWIVGITKTSENIKPNYTVVSR